MRLKPFLLDEWLDAHEHNAIYNLAASTGPVWTLNESSKPRHRRRTRAASSIKKLVYSRPAGADALRSAIAQMHGVDPEAPVQVVTGASEVSLLILFWLAAEPGANVILPQLRLLPHSLALPEVAAT